MTFSLNHKSRETYLNQYKKHLQDQKYTSTSNRSSRVKGKTNDEVVSLFQTIEDENEAKEAAAKSKQGENDIIQSVDSLRLTMDSGFAELSDNLYDIQDEIRGLNKMVGHGFSLIAEAQKFMRVYLEQIQYLLRILPNEQKQKAYYIEKGMVYLQNAFNENADSDFYTDALEEFRKAEVIEKKDPFALYMLGLIHLSSTKNLDPVKSEIYFKKAARYYLAEVSIDKTNYSLSLLKSKKEFFLEISKSLLFAAKACYIQQKFSQASELAAEAWKALPENVKAGYFQSKYLAANQQTEEAAAILKKVIEQNPYFSKEAYIDTDLILKKEIACLLEKLETEAIAESKEKLDFCLENTLPDSVAKEQLSEIALLVNSNTFIDARKALEMFTTSQKWLLPKGAGINEKGKVEPKISSFDFTGSIIEFIEFERVRVLAVPQALSIMEIEKKEREITKLDSFVITKQLLVDENMLQIKKEWKFLLISLCIVLPFTIIGMNIQDVQSGIIAVFKPIINIIMYGGCVGIVLTAIYLSFKSMYFKMENKDNIAAIKIQERNMAALKRDVDKLKKNI